MQNLEMLNRRRIMDIDARERDEIAAARKNARDAYRDIIVEALSDDKAFLRGFVNHGSYVREATLRLDNVSADACTGVRVEMVDVDTGECYVFDNVVHLLENFAVVENGKVGKYFRVFGTNTAGRFVRQEGKFAVLVVAGVGERRVPLDSIIELV